MTETEEMEKRIADLERIATRQANALQAYLVAVHSKELNPSVAVDLYLANHEALKFLGLPIKTGVKC